MTVKYWPAISDGGGGCGIKCRKPFKPKTMKTNASKYRAMVEAIFIKLSFLACVLDVMILAHRWIYVASTGKVTRAHVEKLVGCRPAILFASAIRSCESEPK